MITGCYSRAFGSAPRNDHAQSLANRWFCPAIIAIPELHRAHCAEHGRKRSSLYPSLACCNLRTGGWWGGHRLSRLAACSAALVALSEHRAPSTNLSRFSGGQWPCDAHHGCVSDFRVGRHPGNHASVSVPRAVAPRLHPRVVLFDAPCDLVHTPNKRAQLTIHPTDQVSVAPNPRSARRFSEASIFI
jgi:hypothetical protein